MIQRLIDGSPRGRDQKRLAMNRAIINIGFWSGILTVICSIAYSIAQAAVLVIGVAPPWDYIFVMSPSLLPS